MSLLHTAHLLVLLFIPTKHFQNMSKGIKLWSTQGWVQFLLQGSMNKVRVVSLVCDMPTGPPLHPYKIWSNYLSLVFMACRSDMPTGPPLHSFQILSLFFFFFDLGFMALSRIFHLYWADRSSKVGKNWRTQGEKPPDHLGFPTYGPSEARTTAVRNLTDYESTLLSTRLRGPTKSYQNMSKGIEVMEHTRMRLSTDGWMSSMLITISPKPIGRGIKTYHLQF